MRRTATITTILSSATALALLATAGDARAGDDDGLYTKSDWPLQTIQRPLTLADSMLEIRGDTFRVNLSSGDTPFPGDGFGKPITVAPDLYFGVDDRLTVGITHERGFCLTGEEGSCSSVYDDLGIEALYGVMRAGTLQAAAHGGVLFPSLADPFVGGVRVGFLTRLRVASVAVVFDPTLYLGIFERDALGEHLELPLDLQYQLNTQTMLYASTGVEGELSGFGDAYRVPIGVGANFAVNERFDFGGELRLANAAGQGASADERWLLLRAALRL